MKVLLELTDVELMEHVRVRRAYWRLKDPDRKEWPHLVDMRNEIEKGASDDRTILQ